ncbi:aldo/keto reductase [Nitrincola sp. MINF-07-Sa-05]|uniref:aldo/keto reductase n=1 Tax=Nitrincola salilacus TaxID=3400273 RepID=UPI003917BDB6
MSSTRSATASPVSPDLSATHRVGLGCMNLSHAYGVPPDEAAGIALLNRALDLGYNHLDTAALYGFGANETLLGKAVMQRRNEFFLASKCGLFKGPDGKRAVNGRPEVLRQTCDDALQRLGTEHIDLYYLHRWDKNVPIEESVGALADLKKAGKIGAIGLSEVSAETLRKAHREYPIAAVQTEYSLWTRNPEIAVLDACRELGTVFVAFSPLGRGVLSDALLEMESLPANDLRHQMPRFQAEHYATNCQRVDAVQALAREQGCTTAQLALAWLLHQDPALVVIPGTTSLQHLSENVQANEIHLSAEMLARLDAALNQHNVSGPRYNAATQTEIDTEEFGDSGQSSSNCSN